MQPENADQFLKAFLNVGLCRSVSKRACAFSAGHRCCSKAGPTSLLLPPAYFSFSQTLGVFLPFPKMRVLVNLHLLRSSVLIGSWLFASMGSGKKLHSMGATGH